MVQAQKTLAQFFRHKDTQQLYSSRDHATDTNSIKQEGKSKGKRLTKRQKEAKQDVKSLEGLEQNGPETSPREKQSSKSISSTNTVSKGKASKSPRKFQETELNSKEVQSKKQRITPKANEEQYECDQSQDLIVTSKDDDKTQRSQEIHDNGNDNQIEQQNGQKLDQQSGQQKDKQNDQQSDHILVQQNEPNYDQQQLEVKGLEYSKLVAAFEKIEKTDGRILITSIVQSLFQEVIAKHPEDLLALLYLLSNRTAPEFEGKELGIGESLIIKALSDALGRDQKYIKQELNKEGDLGHVAQKSKSSQKSFIGFKTKQHALTIQNVFQKFKKISQTEGKGSQELKMGIMKELIRDSQLNEVRFIIRQLQGKMRIGLAQQTILVALGKAVYYSREEKGSDKKADEAVNIIKQVYSEVPVYEQIVPHLLDLKIKIEDLPQLIKFTPGIPIKAMLAKPQNSIQDVLKKFQDTEFISELKYDGERAQIHMMEDGSVHIYSRNQENNTSKYPDIVELIPKSIKKDVRSIILDAEVVGYDRKNDRILSFQETQTRKRKNVQVQDIQIQVCVYVFDCLYVNGESLLHCPLRIRREHVQRSLNLQVGQIQVADGIFSTDVDELQLYLEDAIKKGTEGLIVKTLEGTYEPSKRSTNWTKLKKDYMDSGGDSIDVVLMGAKYGQGKRTGVFGSYLIGLYDPDSEKYATLSKIGTGFSDEFLQELLEMLQPLILKQAPSDYQYNQNGFIPDVWFEPKYVWEIKAADITLSPAYMSAYGVKDENKGISIRFPRFLRIREDKKPSDATSTEQIVDMYNLQFSANKDKPSKEISDDEY